MYVAHYIFCKTEKLSSQKAQEYVVQFSVNLMFFRKKNEKGGAKEKRGKLRKSGERDHY